MLLKRLNVKRYFDEPDVPTSKIFDCIWKKWQRKHSHLFLWVKIHVDETRANWQIFVTFSFSLSYWKIQSIKIQLLLKSFRHHFEESVTVFLFFFFFRFLLKSTKVKHSEENKMSHEIWLLVSVCALKKQTF